ncbi:MAG: C40 family peptidase [Prevotella sp.]|nr:C40 family peptidase [Bacteroides sp.]MCM1365787.1 C40 family peptidase [Prevotella sp.]MCM1436521.1 C40 family peptidase [Prevotella sp.]
MNLKNIIAASLIFLSPVIATAQTPSKAQQARQKAHKEQLANVKNRLDKSIISDFVSTDVANRENSFAGLSSESASMLDDILKEGAKHLGKKYVHGAKGPNQFDCSGFTSYVYKQFGYSISPGSRIQYTQGVPVARNELRKGDLVFFTSRSSGKNVGHVGIVVSADNEKGTFRFIHASVKGVRYNDFEGYYVPRYVGARRIITK